jgi:hypothetical protein
VRVMFNDAAAHGFGGPQRSEFSSTGGQLEQAAGTVHSTGAGAPAPAHAPPAHTCAYARANPSAATNVHGDAAGGAPHQRGHACRHVSVPLAGGIQREPAMLDAVAVAVAPCARPEFFSSVRIRAPQRAFALASPAAGSGTRSTVPQAVRRGERARTRHAASLLQLLRSSRGRRSAAQAASRAPRSGAQHGFDRRPARRRLKAARSSCAEARRELCGRARARARAPRPPAPLPRLHYPLGAPRAGKYPLQKGSKARGGPRR